MEQKDILNLASLSRISIDESETKALYEDINAVLEYVSVINDITADIDLTKKVGARYNIFREDKVTCESDEYTEALLAEAPQKDGRFLKVKKILQQD